MGVLVVLKDRFYGWFLGRHVFTTLWIVNKSVRFQSITVINMSFTFVQAFVRFSLTLWPHDPPSELTGLNHQLPIKGFGDK